MCPIVNPRGESSAQAGYDVILLSNFCEFREFNVEAKTDNDQMRIPPSLRSLGRTIPSPRRIKSLRAGKLAWAMDLMSAG